MSALTEAQVAEIREAVRALPPMPADALSRIAVLFASLDERERRRRVHPQAPA